MADTPRTRFNCACPECGYVWTSFFMPIEALALSLLARAVDAMSRTEPNGVPTSDWDAIVTEGTELLQKAVAA